jgi:hypothetical protein
LNGRNGLGIILWMEGMGSEWFLEWKEWARNHSLNGRNGLGMIPWMERMGSEWFLEWKEWARNHYLSERNGLGIILWLTNWMKNVIILILLFIYHKLCVKFYDKLKRKLKLTF